MEELMKKPIKIYGKEIIDQSALDQFYSAMEEEYSIQGALMADAHKGYGLPIGGVVATKDHIVPSWVGFDIGCGVCAILTSYEPNLVEYYKTKIFEEIYKTLPVGFKRNEEEKQWEYEKINKTDWLKDDFNERQGLKQLGTLGSGNHFVEIGLDEKDKTTWIIVHSGSRNLGHRVATRYMKIASKSDKAKEGHYPLHVDSLAGKNYITDMNFCLDFALENRRKIVITVAKAIKKFVFDGYIDWNSLINRNHNHAEYNEELELWIHRKGATHAEKDMFGVIPGNMRDGTFITLGKGNIDSLYSSSHGAGRVGPRTQAKKDISLDTFKEQMIGIEAKVCKKTLAEAPDAYKNIYNVLGYQKDLFYIVKHLSPLINIKA
jgi:tRNA-splicing ligase RtcB